MVSGPSRSCRETLRFSDFDEATHTISSDRLALTLADKVRVQFTTLGLGGRVARIDAALESISWGSETVAVMGK